MITEYDNFINKEDLEASIEELQELESNQIEYSEDLIALIALNEEAEQYCSDWEYGDNLINDYYFDTFTKEMAEDCYEIPQEWPFRCIDWEQAADELRDDYTAIKFHGKTFLCR